MDDVEALTAAVLADQPSPEVARWAFPKLVNGGRYATARGIVQAGLLHEPPAGQPLTEQDRDVVFCLAVLGVQTGSPATDVGYPSETRARFTRVRDTTVAGSTLWWAAFNGELQAIDQTGDATAAVTFIEHVAKSHPAIKLGYPEMMRLVNAGRYDAARDVVRRSNLGSTGFAQPGSVLPLTEGERDCLFFLAVLDAQIGSDGRAAGEPAMGRSRFARVRAATPPGSDLWWAALRGELQSLDLLEAQDEAATLTSELQATHPDLVLPDDIAVRIASPDVNVRRH